MSGAFLYIAGASATALFYALVASGFFLASLATRHFCFAAASAFVLAPYIALGLGSTPLGAVVAVLAAAAAGSIYCQASRYLAYRGAREGQLLIVSIAAMIVVENVLVLSFGNVSITLQRDFVASLWPHAIAAAVVVLLLRAWRATIAGKLSRALLDSPLNLALRGVPVARVEIGLAMAGFALLAVAGLLWASDGRVKPSMCLEIGLIGAVAFIVGKMFGARLVAVMLAAIGLAGARVALSYFVEGDWSMTAVALLLLAALTLRRGDHSAIALRL
jgi:branched-subunit amino acid ABC-type transport system permease component